jgi:DNA-binding response OmpR family regulator
VSPCGAARIDGILGNLCELSAGSAICSGFVFYSMVIVDRTLADGDGITLCSGLRTGDRPGRVFVLVLSPRDSKADIGQSLRAGADAYLSKRTSDAELLAHLNAANAVEEFAPKFRHAISYNTPPIKTSPELSSPAITQSQAACTSAASLQCGSSRCSSSATRWSS